MSMKRFQEVFPNYRPQEDTAGLVKQLEISRVAANEDYSLRIRRAYGPGGPGMRRKG